MKNERKVAAVAQWHGSCRASCERIGTALGDLVWCGVPFAGGMPELPYIRTRTGIANDLHRHLINLARVIRERPADLVDRLEGDIRTRSSSPGPSKKEDRMKFETLEHLGKATSDLADLFRETETNGPISTTADELVDDLVGIAAVEEAVEAFLERIKKAKELVSRTAIDRFLEVGQTSVSRRGKTVYIANEYWPGPRIADLLPPGADENDPNYAATVAKCREAAKDRLLQALKNSAEFSDLVVENYNTQSLRSALTGKEARRDESDKPILPPELDGIVDLNPTTKIRIRKGGKTRENLL